MEELFNWIWKLDKEWIILAFVLMVIGTIGAEHERDRRQK